MSITALSFANFSFASVSCSSILFEFLSSKFYFARCFLSVSYPVISSFISLILEKAEASIAESTRLNAKSNLSLLRIDDVT